VGSDQDINVKVRVIAATNKNLQQEIENGHFREDLYHRICVIIIHVPPLSERVEDIPLLARHFINQICEESGMAQRSIEESALAELSTYRWTGNIRELRNVIERLMILSNNIITKEDVDAYAKPIFR
jgi:DNA-binding NtrC family response regulator